MRPALNNLNVRRRCMNLRKVITIMSTSVEQPAGSMDAVKWLLAIFLLAAAVVGNVYFEDQSVLVRAIGIVASIGIALAVLAQTIKGKTFIAFAKEAQIEVRKVIWPTRQEATQTTIIVMVATAIVALILWGLDSVLFWLVGLLTGLSF